MSNMLKIITEELINKVKINSLLTQYFYDWVIFVEESFFVLRNADRHLTLNEL